MEFLLESIGDAFSREEYILEREEYNLYAILLASPSDRNIFPELLLHFEEIHILTGKNVLIIAPALHIGIRGKKANTDEVLEIFRTQQFPQFFGWKTEMVDVSKHIAKFMKSQMQQSYELLSYLNLSQREMPCIVFFDDLKKPSEFVCWRLYGKQPEDVIKVLRKIISTLREKCRWDLKKKIINLKKQLNDEWPIELLRIKWNNDYDRELLENYELQLKSLYTLRHSTSEYLSLLKKHLQYLEEIFNNIKGDSNINIPIENIKKSISLLLANPDSPDLVRHLRRYKRRWKTRMPEIYRSAIKAVIELYDKHENKPNYNININKIELEIFELERKCKKISLNIIEKENLIKKRREDIKKELKKQYNKLTKEASKSKPRELDVLHSMDRLRMIRKGINEVGKTIPAANFFLSISKLF